MKRSGGSANPKVAQELLRERLTRIAPGPRCASRPARPPRIPGGSWCSWGSPGSARVARVAAPPHVAIDRTARRVRARALHERRRRRAARDLARRLRVLLAAGGRGEGAGRAYLAAHDAAARARRSAAGAAAGSGGAAAGDLVRARRPGGRSSRSRGARGSARSCCSRLALVLLVLSKVHAITKNGLTMAYAPPGRGLDAGERAPRPRRGRRARSWRRRSASLFLKLFGARAGRSTWPPPCTRSRPC